MLEKIILFYWRARVGLVRSSQNFFHKRRSIKSVVFGFVKKKKCCIWHDLWVFTNLISYNEDLPLVRYKLIKKISISQFNSWTGRCFIGNIPNKCFAHGLHEKAYILAGVVAMNLQFRTLSGSSIKQKTVTKPLNLLKSQSPLIIPNTRQWFTEPKPRKPQQSGSLIELKPWAIIDHCLHEKLTQMS